VRDDLQPATLELLDRAECERLLRQASVGRVAVNRRGHGPLVVPVNYVVDDAGRIVFRSDSGAKLARVTRGAVAFQVDEFDHDRATGWSVLVDGMAHEIEAERGAAAAVEPWLQGPMPHAVRIVPTNVTGRRLSRGQDLRL